MELTGSHIALDQNFFWNGISNGLSYEITI